MQPRLPKVSQVLPVKPFQRWSGTQSNNHVMAFISWDLKCCGAWDTTCDDKARDITPSIAWRKGVERGGAPVSADLSVRLVWRLIVYSQWHRAPHRDEKRWSSSILFAAIVFEPFLPVGAVVSTCLWVNILSKWTPRYLRWFVRLTTAPTNVTDGMVTCLRVTVAMCH